jgi:hypothetical protein
MATTTAQTYKGAVSLLKRLAKKHDVEHLLDIVDKNEVDAITKAARRELRRDVKIATLLGLKGRSLTAYPQRRNGLTTSKFLAEIKEAGFSDEMATSVRHIIAVRRSVSEKSRALKQAKRDTVAKIVLSAYYGMKAEVPNNHRAVRYSEEFQRA